MRRVIPTSILILGEIAACGARSDLDFVSSSGGRNATQVGASTGGRHAGVGGASVNASGGTNAFSGISSVVVGGFSGRPATGGSFNWAGSASVCRSFATPTAVGSLVDYPVTELSGIVASRRHRGLLYAVVDSGAPPELGVFDQSGKFFGAIELVGATAVDWEDVSIGLSAESADLIYVADIGDNDARDATGFERASIQLYRFEEPSPSELSPTNPHGVASWEVASYKYPSAPCDAEALFVDPVTQAVILVTKANDGTSLVFSAPIGAFGTNELTSLELVGQFSVGVPFDRSALVTAADIAPNGKRIIIRTYTSIWLFPRLDDWEQTFASPPLQLPSAAEPQSEGLTFNADGTAWLSAGEQSPRLYWSPFDCQ